MSPDVKGLESLEVYRKSAAEPARLYPDLHDHVRRLAEQDRLWTIDRPPYPF